MTKKYKYFIAGVVIFVAMCISICFIPINITRFIPLVEANVSRDLGINIHIEKLILRLGPSLKVKAPTVHLMYPDGQKFGQINNIKFFIPWNAIINKNNFDIKRLYADKFLIKISSKDSCLNNIVQKLNSKDYKEHPNIKLKGYSILYSDVDSGKVYKFNGSNLEISKMSNHENFQIKSIGEFFINSKKYISYDISILPNIDIPSKKVQFDIKNFLCQLEELNFYSDVIADLKLYNNLSGNLQISGLVNLDNISVLDPEKKSPKSFIYLTFLGEKIGILSNIYATDNKKVYIDGVVNNSKKKSIDIKVKTDDIKIREIYNKIRLIADFSKYNAISYIDGDLKADFTLKGDINKIKSSGYLKITNGSVKANGLDVNNISSDIDFSNNTINIVNAIGYVNKAPIMLKGSINKNINIDLLMNKVELKHLLPITYGIKNGVASVFANISGTLSNISHRENVQIENFKCVQNGNSISFASLKIDTSKENVAYINNILINTNKTSLIKVPVLKLNVDRDSITIPSTNIFMANSKLTGKAEVLDYNTKNLTFNFNVNGFINSKDLLFIKKNHATYPIKLSVNGNKTVQNIAAQIFMEKALILDEPAIINLTSKLENNDLKIEDLSISPFAGKISNDFRLNQKNQKKLIISGLIEDIKNPVFKNLRIFVPQQLNITYFDTIAQLRGDIFINGNIKKPEIVGQLTAQNIINQFLQLVINNLTIDFNKSTATLNVPQIKLGDSVFGINSTFSTNLSKELLIKNINIKSKFINTDTFYMYKDSPSFNLLPVRIEVGTIYSEKVLASIYNSPLHLTAFASDFDLKNNILSLKNIFSETFNGKLAGKLDFNLKDEYFNSNIQARGVSASPIFNLISTRKDSVSGVMDFDTSLSGNLSSKQSLNGNIRFIVHNGRMGSLGKLEHLLYAQNVIADNMLRTSLSVITKAITLKDTGLFKYLRGDIALKNGIADIKFLQSQGPLMSLFIKGTYNPDTDYAKLLVLGRLSDEIISGLGVFGDFSFNKLMIMLTGEENNKYNILPEDLENLPQLPTKYTKEFRSIINGIVDKPSSVILFNWISYSEKSYKQKDVPMENVKIPDFINSLPD